MGDIPSSEDFLSIFEAALNLRPTSGPGLMEMDLSCLRHLASTTDDLRQDIRDFVTATQGFDSGLWCRITSTDVTLVQ